MDLEEIIRRMDAMADALADITEFVKGCYRVSCETRNEARAARAAEPKQAELWNDGFSRPGDAARAVANAPRRWGNAVKVYEWLWKCYEGDGFTTDCVAKHAANLPVDESLPVSVPTALRVVSALVAAGAATRKEGRYWLRKPTDALREAVEIARKGRGTA